MGTQPIPWWVILLAILLGILFLIIAVVVLWKVSINKFNLVNSFYLDSNPTIILELMWQRSL